MIAVSYLKSKYDKLEIINKINESDADLIHVDLMDGLYVENKNFTLEEVLNDLKGVTKLLDIHLMVKEPEKYIEDLAKLNVWAITFHLDGTNNPLKTIELIKKHNIKVGIAINPNEDIDILDDYYDLIQYVLVMSVYPGKGGQEFIPEVVDKISKLKTKNVLVGIDGGINDKTIKHLNGHNLDVVISGSYVCMSDNFNEKISELKKNI